MNLSSMMVCLIPFSSQWGCLTRACLAVSYLKWPHPALTDSEPGEGAVPVCGVEKGGSFGVTLVMVIVAWEMGIHPRKPVWDLRRAECGLKAKSGSMNRTSHNILGGNEIPYKTPRRLNKYNLPHYYGLVNKIDVKHFQKILTAYKNRPKRLIKPVLWY